VEYSVDEQTANSEGDYAGAVHGTANADYYEVIGGAKLNSRSTAVTNRVVEISKSAPVLPDKVDKKCA
jgi:hypothetical protein